MKLSSYLGPLVREHVSFTLDDWRLLGDDLKVVLWKSVQVFKLVSFSYVNSHSVVQVFMFIISVSFCNPSLLLELQISRIRHVC